MSQSDIAPRGEGDAGDDQTGRFVRQPNGRVRPLSPHLQIWRWHVTMLGSILHRLSGSALVAGAILVAAWIAALAFGPEAHAAFVALAGSPPGLIVWFGLSLAGVYHLFSGIRHLVWDAGAGLTPRAADGLTTASIVGAILATLAFWALLFASGKVSL